MTFNTGDFYIYRGLHGENVLWVRSREGHWHRMFTEASEPSPMRMVNDEDIEAHLRDGAGMLVRYGQVYAQGVYLYDSDGNRSGRIVD